MSSCSALVMHSVIRACRIVQPRMAAVSVQCPTRRQWRPACSTASPRRTAAVFQLGRALGSARPGLPGSGSQRQQQQLAAPPSLRRQAAAASSSSSTSEAPPAADTTQQQQHRKELPKNFDPTASEEALYQWCDRRRWDGAGLSPICSLQLANITTSNTPLPACPCTAPSAAGGRAAGTSAPTRRRPARPTCSPCRRPT